MSDLGPRMCLDLWKLELLVVGVHLADLIPCRSAKHLDYLHQLVDAAVAREYWLTQKQFGQHTARRPHIYAPCTSTHIIVNTCYRTDREPTQGINPGPERRYGIVLHTLWTLVAFITAAMAAICSTTVPVGT